MMRNMVQKSYRQEEHKMEKIMVKSSNMDGDKVVLDDSNQMVH